MTTLTAIKTLIKGNYNIEVIEKFETFDNGRPSYKVICKDINTGEVVENMSDTVYLSMNAVNEFINSIKETKKPKNRITAAKTIKFDDLMKLFTKYVGKSETRPVLKLVYLSEEGYFTATDSHQLLRVNKKYVSDIPENVVNGSLFDPKLMELKEKQLNFPEVSRLIPQYSDSTVLLNNNIKEFHQYVKAAKKSISKIGVIGLNFTQKQLRIIASEQGDEKYIENVNSVYVEGKEINIHVNPKYLNTSLEVVKKLSKISNGHIEMGMTGHMRPVHIKQHNVFDVIVLPVRVY